MSPPARRIAAAPFVESGTPCAMCTIPSTPNPMHSQPTTSRPREPGSAGWRTSRHASRTSRGGNHAAPDPTALRSTFATTRPAGPPADHQTAAAVTTPSAKTARPSPSRRAAGSSLSSRAPLPTARTAAPSPRAMPSQMPRISRQTARTRTTSTGCRLGARPRPLCPRLAAFAGVRLRAAVERVPERAGDRPPLVEVGTRPTVARGGVRIPH